METMSGKYPGEVKEQRNKLASEIRATRRERDTARANSESMWSKIFIVPHLWYAREAGLQQAKSEETLTKGKLRIDEAVRNYERSREETERVESGAKVEPVTPRTVERRKKGEVISEQRLLQDYLESTGEVAEVYPVATDSFIKKSKDQYNAAWLARELVQNFVDHNTADRGTLNGVTVTKEELENGDTRYTINGPWPYEDPTGVLSPHSEKSTETETAGGNGIGLKQAALRYLRDFGVNRFQIQGEGWAANYALVKAADVNKAIAASEDDQNQSRKVKHDWLVARLEPSPEKGSCSYVIETNNDEVKLALDSFDVLGVSDRNPYLKNPDYKNKKGVIKWLLPKEGEETEQYGRMYVNGQVMNVGSKGETSADYWRGPSGVTLQLNDVKYPMSVDRPPLTSHDVYDMTEGLLESMTPEDALKQLKISLPFWSTRKTDELSGSFYSSSVGMVVVQLLVKKLNWTRSLSRKDMSFAELFPGGKYLAYDVEITEKQRSDLEGKGYHICPKYFADLDMPKVSSQLGSLELAMTGEPNVWSAKAEASMNAEKSGVAVAFEDLSMHTPRKLMDIFKERLSLGGSQVTDIGDGKTVRVKIEQKIPGELLGSVLAHPKDEAGQSLAFLRGFVSSGLAVGVIEKAFLVQGDYVVSFAGGYEEGEGNTLFVKKTPASSGSEGTFLQFTLNDAHLDLLSVLRSTSEVPEKTKGQKLLRMPISDHKAVRPEEAKQFERMAPGISTMLKELDGLRVATKKSIDVVGIYDSGKGKLPSIPELGEAANYLDGRTIGELVLRYTSAQIPGKSGKNGEGGGLPDQLLELHGRLEKLVYDSNPEDLIEDFELITAPNEQQLRQLGMLRLYAFLTTGVNVKNQVFLYKGAGAYGINIRKEAIGLHEEMLAVDFLEAVKTFTHEIAHNTSMRHDVPFMHAMESLFVTTQGHILEIAKKVRMGVALSAAETATLTMAQNWDKERTGGGDSRLS